MTCAALVKRTARGPRDCAQCGVTFIPKPKNAPGQRFCSHACYGASQRIYTPEVRWCRQCGQEFNTPGTKRHQEQTYCSRRCSRLMAVKEDPSGMAKLRAGARQAYVARLSERLQGMGKGDIWRQAYSRGYCAGLRRGRAHGR